MKQQFCESMRKIFIVVIKANFSLTVIENTYMFNCINTISKECNVTIGLIVWGLRYLTRTHTPHVRILLTYGFLVRISY